MKPGSTLIVSFDGLRPDRVTADLMPNLAAFMAEGVRFANARSVFPSETRVAVTSTFTGNPPRWHGMIANRFRHAAVPEEPVRTGLVEDLLRVAGRGPLIHRPALGDRLAAAGRSMVVVSTASTGATHMMNPNAVKNGHETFCCHPTPDMSPTLKAEAEALLGPVPETARPNNARIDYARRVLTDIVWPTRDPDVAVIWMNDPDLTSHAFGVRAPETEASQRLTDAAFGEILAGWRAGRGPEHLIVMSDHGQITGSATASPDMDLPAEYRDRLVSGVFNGLWLDDPAPADLARAVDVLSEMPWCGLVFTGRCGAPAVPGTLPFPLVGQGHPLAPPIAFTLRSTGPDEASDAGAERRYFTEGIDIGGGMHGGLNRGELATVLAGAGPQLRAGFVSDTPCWLPDITPTVLALLGLSTEDTSGRVLAEAFADGPEPPRAAHTVHSVEHRGFQQHLAVWDVEGKSVIDCGWTAGTGAWR
ncbi:alkaline phosphatase family protein [Acuticoccus sediminis]|uniref:alkaline phosphatase family protein n=1 Tax=Acuticoccus sediminis TaxID=2184697 RepID=UPI001CFCCA03|nr:alkaline phosphatase family protein [Acuticoccus sediminis]